MTGLFVALAFMTRLPTPRLPADSNLASAAPWLPVVGAIVGGLVTIAVALGSGVSPWIGALLGLLAWILVTGGLHVEGLGDVADGLGAAHGNRERFIEVARDPHLGGFGAIAIALQLLTKLVLLAVLAERATLGELVASLALVAAWARWAPLALGLAVPPLGEGMASRFVAGIDQRVVGLEAVVLAIATLVVAPVLLAALPLTAVLALYWRVRVGGMNGDCHGASIEVMESALLFLLLLV
ncbi:adenosylcobinamide-GDP ribazoletransferase [Hyphomicrobium sp.]|uniref:adenosylcobinamide-GDP ribazoletransferase n=1 Tax=Hyphomicrobium sp. TaxID=82 RepID=UPI002E2F964B|nr:adenosylcobinamide-GDP ribazoletransferase [Hyphomicrobium sp.]HEX2841047.1 adenosylcobinamide-GDP ribazoletransferase [Hyphomicrobium sp.]